MGLPGEDPQGQHRTHPHQVLEGDLPKEWMVPLVPLRCGLLHPGTLLVRGGDIPREDPKLPQVHTDLQECEDDPGDRGIGEEPEDYGDVLPAPGDVQQVEEHSECPVIVWMYYLIRDSL